MGKEETVKINLEANDSLKMNFTAGKGYQFKIKTPINIQGFIELFDAFTEVFDVSFSLREEQFKKFPKSHIVEGSVKEVNNLFWNAKHVI